MGHQRLGRLPRSKQWKQVVALITSGADVAAIAAGTATATEASMTDAANDPAVKHAFWLVTQVPLAARRTDFPEALRDLDLDVPDAPSLGDIVTGIVTAIDRKLLASGGRSDYGEIALLSACESLYSVASREPDLLGDTSERAQDALARLASPRQFAVLARDFFARLTRGHFAYFLSRELANHTGVGRRFATIREHDAFEQALDLHCREASRVIKEFSAEWFSKQNYEGGIDPAKAGRFVHVAAAKIRAELSNRRDAHG